jgi:hypothetical protein
MTQWGRILVGLGGAALVLQAFLPTYHGLRRHLYGFTTQQSPIELAFADPPACVVTWVVLLPNLIGLHALVLAAGYRPGETLLKLHRGGIWVLVGLYAWTVLLAGVLSVGLFAGRSNGMEWLVSGGAFLGALAVLVVAGRTMWRDEIRGTPPLVQILLYQGIVLMMSAPWLAIPFGEGVSPGAAVGAMAWGGLLAGSHVWLRGLLHEARE